MPLKLLVQAMHPVENVEMVLWQAMKQNSSALSRYTDDRQAQTCYCTIYCTQGLLSLPECTEVTLLKQSCKVRLAVPMFELRSHDRQYAAVLIFTPVQCSLSQFLMPQASCSPTIVHLTICLWVPSPAPTPLRSALRMPQPQLHVITSSQVQVHNT